MEVTSKLIKTLLLVFFMWNLLAYGSNQDPKENPKSDAARTEMYRDIEFKSQFTTEVMDEIDLLLGQTEGLIYLRPWNGSEVIEDDIFE